MNEEKIKELFANEDFVKELFESESFEEAQKKLADKDVEVSVDELKKAYELIQKKQNGELSDEDLEGVAGGFGLFGILVTGLVITGVSVGGYEAYKAVKKSNC